MSNKNKDIKQDFKDWAKGYSGMNGGNPYAPLWFCGIEFGGDEALSFEINEKYSYRNKDNEVIPCWNEAFRNEADVKEVYKTWQYCQKCAKVALQFIEGDIKGYYSYMDKLFSEKGDTFAMNLYPINFPKSSDDYWSKDHYMKTGFPNKITYKAWCMNERFQFLSKLVKKHKPKALICTSSIFKQDFRLAFAPAEELYNDTFYAKAKIDKYECEYFKINDGDTVVFLTPFFGQGGIMSDAGLVALAGLIKKLAI